MDTWQAVSYRIRVLCKDKSLTPNALSLAAGIPQATVKSILNGESRNPGLLTVKKLCDGLGISICEFFSSPIFGSHKQGIE